MTDSAKLRRLRDLRAKIAAGKVSEAERKTAVVTDTDGTAVRLSDPGILAVLDRRIAAEEAA